MNTDYRNKIIIKYEDEPEVVRFRELANHLRIGREIEFEYE